MNYGIINITAAPLRKEPSERSEMVSQLLFGEMYSITREKNDWINIKACIDGYSGWISRNQHSAVSAAEYTRLQGSSIKVLPSCFYSLVVPGSGAMNIIAGSQVYDYNDAEGTIYFRGKKAFLQGDLYVPKKIIDTALSFSGTPYLWGGKSVFGCDCSGFVQTVFRIRGIPLPRDAADQAQSGEAVQSRDCVMAGDLAFFRNEGDEVRHVAIFINPDTVIHSSGYVRTDRIDNRGIVSADTGSHTHINYIIRRILIQAPQC
jgi:gamma-D-glutamyl-L-lysine dipeptidyl-peptidase